MLDERPASWVLLAHLALAPIYTWGTLEVYLAVMRSLMSPAAAELESRYGWILLSHGTVYLVQFTAYHLVRSAQRLRWRERQAAEWATLARDRELAALKAQINPHFLFNTLNSISATVHTAPESARDMIADLAGLLRYALDSASQDAVSLRDEIDFARRYLALEAHRFSDRLRVEVDVEVPESALDVAVPPMILQPLVENAVRHGIGPSESGGTVRLHVERARPGSNHPGSNYAEDGRADGNREGGNREGGNREGDDLTGALRVEVSDTGVGPDTDAPVEDSDGVGMSNTSARLQHALGPSAQLHAEARAPTGFTVWFHVPLASADTADKGTASANTASANTASADTASANTADA
jgi:sensor histidine kinase YesM